MYSESLHLSTKTIRCILRNTIRKYTKIIAHQKQPYRREMPYYPSGPYNSNHPSSTHVQSIPDATYISETCASSHHLFHSLSCRSTSRLHGFTHFHLSRSQNLPLSSGLTGSGATASHTGTIAPCSLEIPSAFAIALNAVARVPVIDPLPAGCVQIEDLTVPMIQGLEVVQNVNDKLDFLPGWHECAEIFFHPSVCDKRR